LSKTMFSSLQAASFGTSTRSSHNPDCPKPDA